MLTTFFEGICLLTVADLIRLNMKRLREERGWTQDQLAKRYGCARSFIAQLEGGHREPSLSGLGELAKALQVDELELIRTTPPPPAPDFEEEYALVPLYEVEAAAGLEGIPAGDHPEVETRLAFRRDWLKRKGIGSEARLRDVCLIRARGDSMEPTIGDGEAILVDMAESARLPEAIRRLGVYVIRCGMLEEGLCVKRLQIDAARGIIVAMSDNPNFRPFEIEVGERPWTYWILGRVLWVGKENV